MCLFANKCGVFTLRAYLQPEPFHVDCASIHEPHGTKAEEEENTDMETSTHKLNFTPLLSLAALPGVLCSPEKEPRAFRGLCALDVPFFCWRWLKSFFSSQCHTFGSPWFHILVLATWLLLLQCRSGARVRNHL